MKLKRAFELCHEPLVASRSHEVKIDRYALIHVLDEYSKKLTLSEKLHSENEARRVKIQDQERCIEEQEKLRGDLTSEVRRLELLLKLKEAKLKELEV